MDMRRFRECLRQGVAPGYTHFACRHNDFGKGDAPPPPDYSGLAASNAESARYAKEIADKDLAFRQQVYADSQPMQRGLYELTQKVATSQLADAETARARGAQQWDQYQKTFVPIESKMAQEAMDYGSAADQQRKAGQAVSDVRQQAALARGSNARAMASMGVNPNSGKFAAMSNSQGLAEAAMAAGGANAARQAAVDKGISLRAGAAGFGRNQVNTAGQMAGIGLNAGNAAVGNANTGFMSGLPYANFGAGGAGNAINAAGLNIKSNLGLAGLQSADYQAASKAYGDSGIDVGGLMKGGAALYTALGSDRRLKKDIELVGQDERTGLNLYEFNYIDNDDTRFIGVMADEVESRFPAAVVYDDLGFASVNYGMLGIQMREVSHAPA